MTLDVCLRDAFV
ncbi:hypothetical protein NM092_003671 [Vibrio cholerae]|nr:hypothetical protein [Vibrio cholerae]